MTTTITSTAVLAVSAVGFALVRLNDAGDGLADEKGDA